MAVAMRRNNTPRGKVKKGGSPMTYPILEHDPAEPAFIEPACVVRPRDVPAHCVLCFFQDVIAKVAAEHEAVIAVENSWEDGPHPLYEIVHRGQRLAICHPGVGAPLAAGLLEELIGYGCRAFVACGGCGVLDRDIPLGGLVVVSAAVRDEGTSYHYIPPAREVEAQEAGVAALLSALRERNIPHRVGKTWTTDAPYRETPTDIARRRQEGCLVVDMEAAALIAVARYRRVTLGQILYGGDDLSGDEWDSRKWQSRAEIRENLFWLAADACLAL
jgi:uridine phosphorylase